MKYALLLILVLVVFWWLKRAGARASGGTGAASRPVDPAATASQAMVRCVRCGVHLPLGEAVTAGADHFCCEEHRRLGRSAER